MILEWERQEHESHEAYKAFCFYRDYEPRSKRSIDKAYCKAKGMDGLTAPGRWRHWTMVHRWRFRAECWDRELERQAREAKNEEIRKMSERQAQAAQTIQQVLMLPVMALGRKMQTDRGLVELLAMASPAQLLNQVERMSGAWATAVKVERLARGESTEIHQIERNLSSLSEEELDAYLARRLAELNPGADTDPTDGCEGGSGPAPGETAEG